MLNGKQKDCMLLLGHTGFKEELREGGCLESALSLSASSTLRAICFTMGGTEEDGGRWRKGDGGRRGGGQGGGERRGEGGRDGRRKVDGGRWREERWEEGKEVEGGGGEEGKGEVGGGEGGRS
jgi:hypothetical protein